MKEKIHPEGWPRPSGYSYAVKATGGTTLYIAGQIALDEKGNLIGKRDVIRQVNQALANLVKVVETAGGRPEDLVKLNIYVLSIKDYYADPKGLREVYRKYLGDHYPAMTLVEVKELLEPGTLIEIDGVAVLDG